MPPASAGRSASDARERLLETLRPVVRSTGYELEDVSVTSAGRRSLVRVSVDTDGGPVCVCGKVGCLEAWLSVPSLSKRLAEASAPSDREGILRDAGERLGIALAPVVGALDLSEIVLSGPTELLDGPLAEATVETLRARTLAQLHDSVRVRMSEQGQDIVLRGTAVMVLSGQLGVS